MNAIKILVLMIGILLFSACSSVKYRIIHKDALITKNCEFDKVTSDQLDYLKSTSIGHSIGRHIKKMWNDCQSRDKRNLEDVETHNKAHK